MFSTTRIIKIKKKSSLFKNINTSRVNICILNLLHATGIHAKEAESTQQQKSAFSSIRLHPFPVFLHLFLIYNVTFAIKVDDRTFVTGTKTRYFSMFSCICSVLVWHVVRRHGQEICSFLKASRTVVSLQYCKVKKVSRRRNFCSYWLFLSTIVVLLSPILYPIYATCISDVPISAYVKAWCLGYHPSELDYVNKMIISFGMFGYSVVLLWFPQLFLLTFYFTTFKLANLLENTKVLLQNSNIWQDSLSQHSYMHHDLLNAVKMHENMFSFSIFLQLCLLISNGFSGFTLEMERHFYEGTSCLEVITHLLLSAHGILTITYVASIIPRMLKEIRDFYRNVYEHAIIREEYPLTADKAKKLEILKVICERPIISLTAWNIVRLDKNLVFSTFGGMLTYGLLILQLNTNKQ